MTVGFFHSSPVVTPHVTLAGHLIRSIRHVMPLVRIVQLTDTTSVRVPGVDAVREYPWAPVALACLQAYAACVGDWLFVDTDVLIRRDVQHVFDLPFDIAVSDRAGTLTEKDLSGSLITRMPFNKGAVFSRSQAFWKDAAARLAAKSEKAQAWMGDQQAMCDVIASGAYDVRVLPNGYNYPPKARTDNVSDKSILHLKGPRKAWIEAFA